MIDMRPVGFVIGLIIAALGATMIIPFATDLLRSDGNAHAFGEAAMISVLCGAAMALACQNRAARGLSIRQAFLLTAGIWLFVPLFGALPFVIGAPDVRLIDAYFEAVSGITTTGASVFVDVEELPRGVTLWRGMLNWLGGLGIAFIAMIFLPVLRVGGMQFFRTEGFDTFGKVLPRASDIARQLFYVYAGLTVACIAVYALLGMPLFEAAAHGLATIATGGFSPRTTSFTDYSNALDYAASLFMILGSLPYIRYVQLVQGSSRPLFADPQVRAYLAWVGSAVLVVAAWRITTSDQDAEPAFRESLFNLVSIMSSTGFGTGDFPRWGAFALIVGMWLGVIGACSGSSAAGLSVFRVQIMLGALVSAVRRIYSPSRIALVRYAGRTVDNDTMDAIVLYLGAYILTFGFLTVGIDLSGVDFVSAIFAAWTTIGNIGYSYGPMVAPTGTFVDFPDVAKIFMIVAMIMGRLSLLTVLVLLLPRFWRL
ncbi:Trk system potassium uptake protein TrkI [Defluviimonas aquaemixtae]|uniref:Trk system potassium uptake protein n=1 Tax=Albidovulum aquaemixtae TaxID=1542388 RepID=A0A2R8B3C7_9RHOB|nr:TrkH family potassium uptake protein [Defluviimonas aquaemixtae]SPH17108.1 Trk system potassium uptake protein TrkI [Defluviimonas aquaemixtae]